jgi:hypothetical protein
MRGNDDWLAYSAALDLVLAGKTQAARAVRARDGQDVWSGPVGPQPLVLRGTTFMSQAGNIYDTATGKLVASDLRLSRGGCNYCVANEYLLLMRDRSASYIDLQMRFKQELYAVRSGCSNSLIAADGVLSVPNFAVGCVCNYPIQACFALLHMPETAAWNKTPGAASEAGRQTGP